MSGGNLSYYLMYNGVLYLLADIMFRLSIWHCGHILSDQLNMTVLFWNLVKRDLS